MPSNAASEGSWTITNPPLLFRLQALAAVRAGARKDDADCAFAAIFGKRAQEDIESCARSMTLRQL